MKYIYVIIAGLAITILFTSCSSKEDVPVKPYVKKSAVQGEFKVKQYTISDHEHITIYDMPDRFAAHRCWVFTNEKISQSHMRCDSDSAGTEMPDYIGLPESTINHP